MVSREKVGPTWPLHSHYCMSDHDPVSAMDTICGLVLCSTDWSTFLPSCVLIVTKPSGIFLLPPTQHSVFLFCGSITDSKGLGNPSGGFITWNCMLWSMVKTTLAHKIDQCGLLHYVLRKKNTRNQAKWCQVLMLWLSKVQVHVRDCLITQGTVL